MSSQLNVDTIVDKAGSSGPSLPNTTTIKMGNTSTYVSDGGAVTQNTVQGLAKMWVHFAGSGSQTVGDSFNHASITDDAVGRYTVDYTNNMNNTSYSGSYDATAVNNNSGEATYIQTHGTSAVSVKHYENGTNYDSAENTVTIHGDLA